MGGGNDDAYGPRSRATRRALFHGLVLSASIAIAGCGPELPATYRIRECRTTDGEVFRYLQRNGATLAEDYRRTVNGQAGVRDTDGWWRAEKTIATCREYAPARKAGEAA